MISRSRKGGSIGRERVPTAELLQDLELICQRPVGHLACDASQCPPLGRGGAGERLGAGGGRQEAGGCAGRARAAEEAEERLTKMMMVMKVMMMVMMAMVMVMMRMMMRMMNMYGPSGEKKAGGEVRRGYDGRRMGSLRAYV